MYKLYAKIENNIVKEFKNSWQLSDHAGYTEIYETQNRHAASNYELRNGYGTYKYKYENGELIERTAQERLDEVNNSIERKIERIKSIVTPILVKMTPVVVQILGEDYGEKAGISTKPKKYNSSKIQEVLQYMETLRDIHEDERIEATSYTELETLLPEMPEL